jgi:aryl sulfotransferase
MRTFWLASYPKCGNTWLRMMIGALARPDDRELDINEVSQGDGIASGRRAFDYHTLLGSDLLTYDEIDRLRPAVHAARAAGLLDEDDEAADRKAGAETRFVKTHDAYTRLADGTPLLGGARGADGAVLIVRDPRDVASSIANHSGLGLDKAIAQMCDRTFSLCAEPDRLANQLRQQLLDWSGFAESWLTQTDLPVLLVRYEDMQSDATGTLGRVMTFAGNPQPAEALARAAALADFARLKRQEAETGFRERPPQARGGFFRRGEAGAWRDELTPEQAARIEAAHGPMMTHLGYEPCERLLIS